MSDTPEPLPVEFLIDQGCCCGSGCYHCPYIDEVGNRHQAGETHLSPELNPSHPISETQASSPQK